MSMKRGPKKNKLVIYKVKGKHKFILDGVPLRNVIEGTFTMEHVTSDHMYSGSPDRLCTLEIRMLVDPTYILTAKESRLFEAMAKRAKKRMAMDRP